MDLSTELVDPVAIFFTTFGSAVVLFTLCIGTYYLIKVTCYHCNSKKRIVPIEGNRDPNQRFILREFLAAPTPEFIPAPVV